jgi:hypothetical protein
MPKAIEIQGHSYFVHVKSVRGSTGNGEFVATIELFDGDGEEPSWMNDVPSVEPVHTIELSGDAGSLYYQLKEPVEVLNSTRNW